MVGRGRAGAVIGGVLGVVLGYVVDRTLTQLGAGPAPAAGEFLVTVYARDEEIDGAKAALAGANARHVLAA